MLVYNKKGLDNVAIREDAETACQLKCITSAERDAIENTYPTGFFTPHWFIRAGLFVLTYIIVSFTYGIFLLAFSRNGGEKTFYSLMVVTGLIAYGVMEFVVHQIKHYRSGVDDALLWTGTGLLLTGLTLLTNPSALQFCALAFLISAFAAARTADVIMAVICLLSILGMLFFGLVRITGIGPSILPFVLMIASLLLYFGVQRAAALQALHYYRHMGPFLLTVCLLAFYAAGNYFTVSMAHAAINAADGPSQPIALGWLFWIFSTTVPLVYLYVGIRKKDAILLRTGLVLVAAAVFTIRYYHHLLSLEWAMVLGGLLLVGIAYMLIRYLKTPKFGFSDEPEQNASRFGKLQLESLIITQTIHAPAQGQGNHVEFGGGSGGGGGAGGTF